MSKQEIKKVFNSLINKQKQICDCHSNLCEFCNGCIQHDELKKVGIETTNDLIADFENWLDNHDLEEAKNFSSLSGKRQQTIINELSTFGIKSFILNNYESTCEDCYYEITNNTNQLLKKLDNNKQVTMMTEFFDWYLENVLAKQEQEIKAQIKLYQNQHQIEK